jgi:predicted permease
MNGPADPVRLPAAAGGLLALASLLVPDDRRDEWLESWQAELLHWSQRRRKSGRGASAAVLTLRALGAFPHAAWERAREFERAASDVRHGARRLLRTPGFTTISIITLALGIGATAAILSIVHAILLRPLPYDQADDLVVVWHASEALGYDRIRMTTAMFLTIEEDQAVFEQFGAWTAGSVTVTGLAEPESVDIISVSAGVFPALRVRAELGRLFQSTDVHHEAPFTTVLSHGYWQARFGSDPSVIGRVLTLDGVSTEVIGVLPAGTRFLDRSPDLYLPLQVDPENAALLSFDFNGLARLKPGIDPETVRTDLSRTLIPSVERYGWTTPERAREFGLTPNVQPLREQVVGNIASTLWVLLGAVGLVLLLAFVNVANLLLVRAEARRREVAVRKALGAGRNRIARHFAAETVLLGLAGGAAGIGLAYVALNVLLRMAPASLPRTSEIGLSPTVLLATLGLAVGAGLLFGLISVSGREGKNLATALREGGRSRTSGKSSQRTRSALASLQVALALVLLLGSALMLRSFLALRSVDPGFERPEEVLTFRLTIPGADVPEDDAAIEMQRQIVERLAAIPGVTSVGLASGFAMEHRSHGNELYLDGSRIAEGLEPSINYKAIGADYFEAMEIPLLAGRPIRWDDITDRRPVGLITENLARRHFGDPASALGRRIRHTPDEQWREVIGVVGDVRDDGLASEAPGVAYWPMAVNDFLQFPSWVRRNMAYVLRTEVLPPTVLLPQVREAVWSVNPNLPLAGVRTLDEVVRRDVAPTEFVMTLLLVAAAVALVLGAVGVYGVISYSVAQRTREIGIRMALGATAGDVKRLGLRHGLVIAGAGGLLGALLAFVLGRAMTALLYGVTASDPLSLAAISALLLSIVLAAAYVPARRATRVEPTVALRTE